MQRCSAIHHSSHPIILHFYQRLIHIRQKSLLLHTYDVLLYFHSIGEQYSEWCPKNLIKKKESIFLLNIHFSWIINLIPISKREGNQIIVGTPYYIDTLQTCLTTASIIQTHIHLTNMITRTLVLLATANIEYYLAYHINNTPTYFQSSIIWNYFIMKLYLKLVTFQGNTKGI